MIEVIEAKNVANGAAWPFIEEVEIADIRGRNEVEYAQVAGELTTDSPRFVTTGPFFVSSTKQLSLWCRLS